MNDPLAEQLNQTFAALAERVRAAIDHHASVSAGQLAIAIQADRQAAADSSARHAAAAAESAVSARLTDEFVRREAQLREAVRAEWFEAGLKQGRQEGAATAGQARRHFVERLAAATRALGGSTSLSETFDALTDAARAEVERVAVFLVRGGKLCLWAKAGFGALDGQPAFEMTLSEAGLIAEAVTAGSARRGYDLRPWFAEDTSAAFVAIPLHLNDQVIAVLCAEDTAADDDGTRVTCTLEVLGRHAAKVLESLTALRLAHAGAHGGGAATSPGV